MHWKLLLWLRILRIEWKIGHHSAYWSLRYDFDHCFDLQIGRITSRTSRNRQDRNRQGSCQKFGHQMLCHQLRWRTWLRGNGRHLLRLGDDRFLGLFRRVQQNHTISAISRLRTTQNHPKCTSQLKEDRWTPQEGTQHQIHRWNIRDYESWIRRQDGIARQREGLIQACDYDRAGSQHHLWDHVDELRIQWS